MADLDAHRFCRGYNTPLAMMGVALDRYLPGRNAMLVNEVYVTFTHIILSANKKAKRLADKHLAM